MKNTATDRKGLSWNEIKEIWTAARGQGEGLAPLHISVETFTCQDHLNPGPVESARVA